MSESRQLHAYGDRGTLVQFADTNEAGAFAHTVSRASHPGVVDTIATEHHVLVVHTPVVDIPALRSWLSDLTVDEGADIEAQQLEIEVVYDGMDLDHVATACRMTVEQVIECHRVATYRAAFCGFAPGFAYLRGLDPRLEIPRRATPRPAVAAGSVAIAAGYCGVYPREMPGGWHIIGHTTARLWDLGRTRPALIEPGTIVHFRVREPDNHARDNRAPDDRETR